MIKWLFRLHTLLLILLSAPSVEKGKPQKRKLASSGAKEGESSAVRNKRRRKNEDTTEEGAAPDEYVQVSCSMQTVYDGVVPIRIVVSGIVNLEEASESFIQVLPHPPDIMCIYIIMC